MDSNIFYSISKKISEFIEKIIVNLLKVFLKSYTGNTIFNKLIDVAVNHLDRSVIDPIVDILIIKIAKSHDISRAKKTIEQLEKAKNELDKDSYNRHVDDLLGGL